MLVMLNDLSQLNLLFTCLTKMFKPLAMGVLCVGIWRQEEGVGFLGAGVIGGCDPSAMGTRN